MEKKETIRSKWRKDPKIPISLEQVGIYFVLLCILLAMFFVGNIIGQLLLLGIFAATLHGVLEDYGEPLNTWKYVVVVAIVLLAMWGYRWGVQGIYYFAPQSEATDCPSNEPIKGNAQSGIYYMPNDSYYTETRPEKCFSSEEEAENAGYRKSKSY